MSDETALETAAQDQLAAARALAERITTTEIKALDTPVVTVDDTSAAIAFSVYGVRDLVGDVVQPGAFAKTMQERNHRVPILWNHDLHSPAIGVCKGLRDIGRADLPAHVLEAYPEAQGAAIADVEFLPTPRGQEILAGLQKAAPYQASFMFDILQQALGEPVNGRKTRLLNEVRLHEVTICHFGANPATYLSKALALLDAAEIKRGSRHSARDRDLLNQIARLVQELTETAAADSEPETDEEAAPQDAPARTSESTKGLLLDIESILRGHPHERIRRGPEGQNAGAVGNRSRT